MVERLVLGEVGGGDVGVADDVDLLHAVEVREAVERAVREHPSVEPRPTAESVKDVARRAARRVLPGPTMVIAIEER